MPLSRDVEEVRKPAVGALEDKYSRKGGQCVQRPESEGGLACCSGNSRETSRTSTHEQRGKGRSTNPRGSKGKSCWILCKQFVRSFAFTLSQKGSHWKVFEQRSDVT